MRAAHLPGRRASARSSRAACNNHHARTRTGSAADTLTDEGLGSTDNALLTVGHTMSLIRHNFDIEGVRVAAAARTAALAPISEAPAQDAAAAATSGAHGRDTTPIPLQLIATPLRDGATPLREGAGHDHNEEEVRMWNTELSKLFKRSDAPRLAWPLLVMRRGAKIVVSLVSLFTLLVCLLAAQDLAAVTGAADAVAGVGLCVDALAAVSVQTQQALWSSLGWLQGGVPGSALTNPFAGSASLLALHAAGVRASCNSVRWNPFTSSVPEATVGAVYVDPWGTVISRNVSLWRLAMELGSAAKVVSALAESRVAAGTARVQFILENNELYQVAPTVLQAVSDTAVASQSSGTHGVVIATLATLSLAVATGLATMWLVVLIERRRNAVLEQLTTIPGAVLALLQKRANEQERRLQQQQGLQNGGARPGGDGGGEAIGTAPLDKASSGLDLALAVVPTALSRRDRERVTRSNPRARISLCVRIVSPLFVVALSFGMLSIAMNNTLAAAGAQSIAASRYIQLKLAVARVHVYSSYAAAIPDGPDYVDTAINAQAAIADVKRLSTLIFYGDLVGHGGSSAESPSRAVDVCASTLGLVGDELAACQAIGSGVLINGVPAGVAKMVESCSGVLAARGAVTLVPGPGAGDTLHTTTPSGANYTVAGVLNGPLLTVSRQLESDGPLAQALAIFSAQQVALVAATASSFLSTLNTVAVVLFVVLLLYFSLVFLPFIRTIQRDIDASKMLLRLLPPAVAVRLAGVRLVMTKLQADADGSTVGDKAAAAAVGIDTAVGESVRGKSSHIERADQGSDEVVALSGHGSPPPLVALVT